MGIIYALLSSVFFALSYTSLKRSYKEFPPSVAFFFDMIFGLIIWIPFSLLLGFDFSDIPQVLPYALVSAILSEALTFYIFSKGEISITGTIIASYPVYTILFAILLLGESLELHHWLFVFLTIIGTLIVSMPNKISKEEIRKKQYVLWAIIGAIAIGLSDTISKGSIDRTSAAAFLFSLAFMQIPISLIYLRLEKENPKHIFKFVKDINKYKYSILGSLLNVLGLIGLWMAFEYTFASIASPLTAAYPGIMIIFAVLWLKEKPRLIELVGLGIIIAGVIGISYYYI
jgi:drug/metabolite transporter (DMT)-like permease